MIQITINNDLTLNVTQDQLGKLISILKEGVTFTVGTATATTKTETKKEETKTETNNDNRVEKKSNQTGKTFMVKDKTERIFFCFALEHVSNCWKEKVGLISVKPQYEENDLRSSMCAQAGQITKAMQHVLNIEAAAKKDKAEVSEITPEAEVDVPKTVSGAIAKLAELYVLPQKGEYSRMLTKVKASCGLEGKDMHLLIEDVKKAAAHLTVAGTDAPAPTLPDLQ